jgi:ADP-heptose:LPS heptosyltransferase
MVKKILIIRFSSIGDIVLTTPVTRCLKMQLGVEVHYLTKRAFCTILESNPYIDKVFAIEKKVGEVLPELRQEKYDAIVDLHRNIRSLKVKWGLWGVRSYSFDKLNWEKWLMVRFKINRLPDIHIVDRYLAAAAPLGIENDGKGLDYFIPPHEEVTVAGFFSDHLPAQPDLQSPESSIQPPPFLVFVIGAAHATKRLPADKIIAICKSLALPVVLLGGSGEAETGEVIAGNAGPHVINACGKLRLHQSASLVRQAQWVITHDTGLMHIAAAFGKEIISVWGNTIPEFGMHPYYPEGVDRNHTMQIDDLPCRPCSKIGFRKCPRGHFRCMRDISPASFVKIIEAGSQTSRV